MYSLTPEVTVTGASRPAAAPLPATADRRSARMRLSLPALVTLGALAGCGGSDPGVPEGDFLPPPVEWRIVFEDDFNGASLDTSKWNIQTGDGCPDLCGWGNNELQTYSADNITVSGGTLNIIGRREGDGSYTSARINTKGKFDFRYGRVEVSARLPSGQGTWPAIWMLHSNPEIYGPWPLSGEIDIMEAFNYGAGGNNSIASTAHYGLSVPPYHGTSSRTELAASANVNFHQYALEWERDRLRFYIDGQHYQTQNSDNWYTYFPADADGRYDPFGAYRLGPEAAPFDQAFHLLLNFAIGGNPVGRPAAATAFPQTFAIDYVRVYECANGNTETGRGCGIAEPAVVPLEDLDGGPLEDAETAQPYVASLNLYVDGPEVITVNIGEEEATNTLGVDGYTGPGATVISNPMSTDPDNPGNTAWRVAVANDVANVYLTSQDLGDDPILETGFNFSGGDAVGEIAFDMRVNSLDPDATLLVKLDSGFPHLGQVALPASELRMGGWKTYSVKFADLVANPGFVDCCGGTGVDLANVINPFVFEVIGGNADVYLDNIRITNACYVVGSCKAEPRGKGVPDFIVFDDAVNSGVWNTGIAAADSGSGFANYTDGRGANNKVNWQIITDADADRGQVIDVTFNDSNAFGVWFIQSSSGVNMTAYAAGAVKFDIIVDDYGSNTTGITMKIDCGFPCTSGDKNLGVIADGVWQTVAVPVSSLTGSGLDLNRVNTGIVIFPTAPQSGTIRFRLDNIRWVEESDAPPLNQIDLPVTFDDPSVDYSLIDFGGTSTVIANDPAGGENQVAQTTHNGGPFAGTVIGTDAGFANPIPFTGTETTMSVRVFPPAAGIPVMLKVEDASDANIFGEVIAATTAANAWETLVYDYLGVIDPINITYEKAVLFFNFPNAGDGSVYHWDDLAFGGEGTPMLRQVDLPVTFDDSGVDYGLGDFGGAVTTLVTDPVNMSNTVASTNKPPGAELWAGTTVGAAAGLATPVPFTGTSTVMSVRVYSPDAGIPVRLKAENAAVGSISVETEAMTTMADAWEILSFDFSNPVASTPALDPSQSYEKVSIFFNFGTDGNTAGDKTYLWDDIQFAPLTPSALVGANRQVEIDL